VPQSTSITCGGTRAEAADRARRREAVLAFHICDWLVPTTDLLLDRGMMGDGVIDIPLIRSWSKLQAIGVPRVEIFSAKNWWKKPRRSAGHLQGAPRRVRLTPRASE